MIAVFASVKGDDGIVRADKFLLLEEEVASFSESTGEQVRPWTWVADAGNNTTDAYEGNNHYARWWWDEWERRRSGGARLSYVPDAHEWRRHEVPRCPWCKSVNYADDDVNVSHPYEEVVSCSSCSQPFSVRRSYVYTTTPVRKE